MRLLIQLLLFSLLLFISPKANAEGSVLSHIAHSIVGGISLKFDSTNEKLSRLISLKKSSSRDYSGVTDPDEDRQLRQQNSDRQLLGQEHEIDDGLLARQEERKKQLLEEYALLRSQDESSLELKDIERLTRLRLLLKDQYGVDVDSEGAPDPNPKDGAEKPVSLFVGAMRTAGKEEKPGDTNQAPAGGQEQRDVVSVTVASAAPAAPAGGGAASGAGGAECPIFLTPLGPETNPQLAPCCGKSFSAAAIRQCLETQKLCPWCERPLTLDQLIPNRDLGGESLAGNNHHRSPLWQELFLGDVLLYESFLSFVRTKTDADVERGILTLVKEDSSVLNRNTQDGCTLAIMIARHVEASLARKLLEPSIREGKINLGVENKNGSTLPMFIAQSMGEKDPAAAAAAVLLERIIIQGGAHLWAQNRFGRNLAMYIAQYIGDKDAAIAERLLMLLIDQDGAHLWVQNNNGCNLAILIARHIGEKDAAIAERLLMLLIAQGAEHLWVQDNNGCNLAILIACHIGKKDAAIAERLLMLLIAQAAEHLWVQDNNGCNLAMFIAHHIGEKDAVVAERLLMPLIAQGGNHLWVRDNNGWNLAMLIARFIGEKDAAVAGRLLMPLIETGGDHLKVQNEHDDTLAILIAWKIGIKDAAIAERLLVPLIAQGGAHLRVRTKNGITLEQLINDYIGKRNPGCARRLNELLNPVPANPVVANVAAASANVPASKKGGDGCCMQ